MDVGWTCRWLKSVCGFMIFTNYAQDGTDSFKTLQSMYQTTRYDERSAWPSGCFIPDQKLPRIHRIQRWVGPISGLEALYKRKPLALPATSQRILRCPALILTSALITQPFSGIKVYAVFWVPTPSDGSCCTMRCMATFYVTFVNTLGFQTKLLI